MKFNSIDEILDFAIQQEEEAIRFYTDLSKRMSNPQTRQVFEGFTREEMGHKRKLEKMKAEKTFHMAESKIQSLDISDYMVDVKITPELDYQDALIIAMKKEKAAFKFYTDLASQADNPEVQSLFLMLAQEEAKHKLRFEIEYDERILTDN